MLNTNELDEVFDIILTIIFSLILMYHLIVSIKDMKNDHIESAKNIIIIITILTCIVIHIIGFIYSFLSSKKEYYQFELENYFFFQLSFDLLNICIITQFF